MPLLVLFLFVLPFLEIYVLIAVGSAIGVLPTIALVLGLSVFGAYLLRRQGLKALFAAQDDLANGVMPANAILDGLGLTVAAALLITPGLITDAMGFILLIPQIRHWVTRLVLDRLLGAHVFQAAERPGEPNRPSNQPGGKVIEGQFKRLDE